MLKAKWNIQSDIFLVLFIVGVVLSFEAVIVMVLTAQATRLSYAASTVLWGYSMMKLVAGVLAMGIGLAPWATKTAKKRK